VLEVGDWEGIELGKRSVQGERESRRLTSGLLGERKRLGSSVSRDERTLREDEQGLQDESRESAPGRRLVEDGERRSCVCKS
jgi:hypothetical protein